MPFVIEFRMSNSFVKIPGDAWCVERIVKLWCGYVQLIYVEFVSWRCLGMLGILKVRNNTWQGKFVEVCGEQKPTQGHDSSWDRLGVIWSQLSALYMIWLLISNNIVHLEANSGIIYKCCKLILIINYILCHWLVSFFLFITFY